MYDLNTLGSRMRYRRKEAGLTQEQLAQAAGTSQSVIQKIENGRSNLPRKIMEIGKALDTNPAWLLLGGAFARMEYPK